MMQKSTALTTIFLVKKCYFHYDMQKNKLGHLFKYVLLRAKKVGHQISVSFEKFDVVQALLSFFLTLFQLTV
jgi:predicted glycosyltransferase